MNPFDRIKTRDNDAFPFGEFSAYPHLFLVDWRESEDWIATNFLRAAGLPDNETTWEWSEAEQRGSCISRGRKHPVSSSGGLSAQHAAVRRTVYDEQPLLFLHGQVVWAQVVQANNHQRIRNGVQPSSSRRACGRQGSVLHHGHGAPESLAELVVAPAHTRASMILPQRYWPRQSWQ